ncbi:hypothetical protein UFOVP46_113 [uncultured Caudovirales phage]|uniref:Uncharacterized protein n=1 Tax=uncultured Caudovirales phage TaxID=2100421 RepID=A0A6J5KSH4_9CAUD|nr:hypothetical protein UFOVP46_113 [uncultured Caudovirales phage]
MSLEDMYRRNVAALKKSRKVNQNLSKAQATAKPVVRETNLSAQYDNDGNPYPTEPKGYTTSGGH